MSNFDDIFEPAPQAEDFDKEAWAAKKKAERDEVYALADATAEEVCADGGKFRDYLDVQANFRHYSATNALLILATKPDARRLGDKDFWRDQGVYIKRQEFGRPIKIVESNGEYTRDDGSIGVSYNIKRVYDISQTTSRMRAQPPVSHDARALLGALIYKKPLLKHLSTYCPLGRKLNHFFAPACSWLQAASYTQRLSHSAIWSFSGDCFPP